MELKLNNEQNKVKSQFSTLPSKTGKFALPLNDNRPKSILQRKQQINSKSNALQTNIPVNSQTIQRFAFINGAQIEPDTPQYIAASPDGKGMIRDNVVRNYKSEEEFALNAGHGTDYIGSISSGKFAGTWVRFSSILMNVLGESHAEVPLDAVTTAVGTTSFAHERFTDAAFNHGPLTNAVDQSENAPRYERYGVGAHHDKGTAHIGEALLPKVAFALHSLQAITKGDLLNWTKAKYAVEATRGVAYGGMPYLTYLKYALATATDKRTAFERDGREWSEELQGIYAQLYKIMGAGEEYVKLIMSSPVGAFLGDFVPEEALPFIHDFSVTYLKLADIAMNDDQNMKDFKYADKKVDKPYLKWRDTYLFRQLSKAYNSGLRYFGMGNTHLKNLSGNIHQEGMNVNEVDMIAYMPLARAETLRLHAVAEANEKKAKEHVVESV